MHGWREQPLWVGLHNSAIGPDRVVLRTGRCLVRGKGKEIIGPFFPNYMLSHNSFSRDTLELQEN